MRVICKIVGAMLMSAISVHGISQDRGIRFSDDTSWNQVLAEAKGSGRFILVDCYATWCGPCRAMDEKVYTTDNVGDFFNRRFVCVKLQMDTSKKDDQRVKAKYAMAAEMATRGHVTVFPTFLFFTPEGSLVHRGEGYHSADDFVNLGRYALERKSQYYTLAKSYEKGNLDGESAPYLVENALAFKDTALAKGAASYWIDHILVRLPKDSLYQPKYIGLLYSCLAANVVRAGDKGFYLFYGHEGKIDSIMSNRMYAELIVDFSISKAEIFPRIWKDGVGITEHPDWSDIQNVVARKFGSSYAERAVAFDKIRWYQWKKDVPELARSTVELMSKYGGSIDDWDKNVYAWTVFQYDEKKDDLDAAIAWMKPVLHTMGENAQIWDTYANLLYKVGNKEAGLTFERKAAQLAPKDKDLQSNLDKMERGEPTWPGH